MILVFTNGVYDCNNNIFYDNENIPAETINLQNDYDSNGNIIVRHDFEFDFIQTNESILIHNFLHYQKHLSSDVTNVILSYCSNWEFIETPYFDRLMEVNFEEKERKLFYIFLGRLFHHFSEKDNWGIIPIIYGQENTIETILEHFLGNYKLCIGRYGIECVMPSDSIWSGLVSIVGCEGTSTRAMVNTINDLMNNRNHTYGRSMYSEQTLLLEDPKFIFLAEPENEEYAEFQFNYLEEEHVLAFGFNTVMTEVEYIRNGIYNEFTSLIRKSNMAYLEACNLYEDKDMLLNS